MSWSKKECNFRLKTKNIMVLGPKARLRPTSCVAEGHYWVAEGHDIESRQALPEPRRGSIDGRSPSLIVLIE